MIFVNQILQYEHSIIKSSLCSDAVPVNFKDAIVQPLIKKPGLDLTVVANGPNFPSFPKF